MPYGLPTNLGTRIDSRIFTPAFFFSESQRDSVPKPRVARYALPWEMVPPNDQPQRGCVLLLESHSYRLLHFTSCFAASSVLTGMTQPRWGWEVKLIVSQGSAARATLGFGTESRWDSCERVARNYGILGGIFWYSSERTRSFNVHENFLTLIILNLHAPN